MSIAWNRFSPNRRCRWANRLMSVTNSFSSEPTRGSRHAANVTEIAPSTRSTARAVNHYVPIVTVEARNYERRECGSNVPVHCSCCTITSIGGTSAWAAVFESTALLAIARISSVTSPGTCTMIVIFFGALTFVRS
jgi:hypothetical protein